MGESRVVHYFRYTVCYIGRSMLAKLNISKAIVCVPVPVPVPGTDDGAQGKAVR